MILRIKNLFVIIVLLGLSFMSCAEAEQLKCYYSIADITPEDSVILAGFAARSGRSTSIHYPLNTHCLVIQDAGQKLCIISNDLMEISIDLANELRQKIAEKSGISYESIFIHCTHTHSAPRTGGWCVDPGQPNENYRKTTLETIVNNAVRAIEADNREYKPFSMQIAKSESMMNNNRCEKDGPCDRDVYALKLVDKKGEPIVALLNYSCHPVSLSHRSLVVSTDFSGTTCKLLEEKWKCPVFYFTGASGNLNPAGGLKADTIYTEGKGKMLAESIENVKFEKLSLTNKLKITNQEIHLPYEVDSITIEALNQHMEKISQWKGVSNTWLDDARRWYERTMEKVKKKEVKNYLPLQVAAVNVGGVVLFFTQGEPFCEYQQALRKAYPDLNVFFIAYTNGQNSYLPSKHAYSSGHKGYDYETKQMHIYIDAPFPLSNKMPDVYESAVIDIVDKVK